MAEIINLRRARKAKERTEQAAKADANRLVFGRPKVEKIATQKAQTQAKSHLDGHKLNPASKYEPD